MQGTASPKKLITIATIVTGMALAQIQPVKGPWRGAGTAPCAGPDGGILQCPPAAQIIVVRAGHLFDSKSGRMLDRQTVVISGDRIVETGPQVSTKIPAGAEIIDLGDATLLPGLIDAHTHMFNSHTGKEGETNRETALLIAVQNAQADLRAGFTSARDMSTHGNGYGDIEIRNAINEGRIDGPRYQVSTLGITWNPARRSPTPENAVGIPEIRSAEEGIAAVREQIGHGADWIKLYPDRGYSFASSGEAQYQPTYPLPVLRAMIDETHRLGKKTGCHVFGGEGLNNAIVAGCDTIEHAFGLSQEQAAMMASKGLFYDPTLVRYTEPYMDDTDARETGGRFRMIPIFEKATAMAAATPGLKMMMGSGVDGSTFPHGTQALELEALVKFARMTPTRAIQSATVVNAEALGWLDRAGSLDKGKYADMIAVSGNPLVDITELQRVKFVMKAGKAVRNDLARHAVGQRVGR